MAYALVKRNKRMMIVDEATGAVVYQPPSFLRPITNREDFAPLLTAMNETGKVGRDALTEFGTRFNPRVRPTSTSASPASDQEAR